MLKLGVVGYGYWGPNVVRNFATQTDCRVTIICDGEPVARARAASHYPTVRTVADAMEVVTSPEITSLRRTREMLNTLAQLDVREDHVLLVLNRIVEVAGQRRSSCGQGQHHWGVAAAIFIVPRA